MRTSFSSASAGRASAGLLVAGALLLAACTGSGSGIGAAGSGANAAGAPDGKQAAPASDTPAAGAPVKATPTPFGSACATFPATGAGSFESMATERVATAASQYEALSTMVNAVTEAGLVDTLNNADGVTVFAPINDAFAALPRATLDKALADPKGMLTSMLSYHVVPVRLSPDQLAGTHTTLQGGKLSVAGSGEEFTINDTAKVICGNVQTANATVYLVDQVLVPTS